MTRGWYFSDGIQHYYVGAADVASAQKLLAPIHPALAKETPEEMPQTLVRFFPLYEGKVTVGRLHDQG